jgi:hypothetical protein
MPVTPAVRRQRSGGSQFKPSLCINARPYLKNNQRGERRDGRQQGEMPQAMYEYMNI